MITLSPNHPVLALKLKIESISFSGGRNTDRLANKVSGKRKRGGQQLVEDSVICTLKCRTPKSPSSSFGTDAQKRDAQKRDAEIEEKDQSFKQSINPGSVSNPKDNPSNDDDVTGVQSFSGAKNSFHEKGSLSDNASKDGDKEEAEGKKEKKGEAEEKKEEPKDGDKEEGLMYTFYPIVSGIKGTLIEINEKLVNNPQLIVDEVRK